MGNNTTTTCDNGGDVLFSEDVLIQILVCLPVISLLRFKSVCKSWRALIETPFFMDLHITTTTTLNSSSNKFGSFIFYLGGNEKFALSSRSSSSESNVCGDNNMDYLGLVPCFDYIDVRMVGSCNGLICIHESIHELFTLWNPATRQFRTLPQQLPMPTDEIPDWIDLAVFGFDVKTKDYKVVLFRCFKRASRGPDNGNWLCRIQVYSLSSDSWRLLEGIHYLPGLPTSTIRSQNQGIYMNGCYFFVGKDKSQVWVEGGEGKALVCNNNLIYSFDFTNEILTTIQSPDHDSRHDFILTNLGDDKLALFMIQRNLFIGGGSEWHDCGLDYEYYHIWVLNDHPGIGSDVVVNKESWTKLHSFRKLNKFKHVSQPRCISNNGEFALISTRRNPDRSSTELQLFNLVTGEATKDFPLGESVIRSNSVTGEATKDFPLGESVIRSDVYRESLISIIGGNGAAETTAERVVGGAT